MRKPEIIPTNEEHKTHMDFEMPTDHLILDRKSEQQQNEELAVSGFCRSGVSKTENKRKKKIEKYLDLPKEF